MKFALVWVTTIFALAALVSRISFTPAEVDVAIHVNTGDDELNQDGDCSLREAIRAANTDAAVDACPAGNGVDTIQIPAGIYALTVSGIDEDLGVTGDLDIYSSMSLLGAGAGTTIIDGSGLDRVMNVIGTTNLVITGVTLRNGYIPGTGPAYAGGGIAAGAGSTTEVNDSSIEGNQAGDSGGGVFNNGGTLTLNRTRITNNSAGFAGGIRNTGLLTINDSSIAGNHAATYAGGIMSSQTLNLNRVTVSSNTAGTNGGGIYVYLGTATVINSTVSGNSMSGSMGGGVWVYYQATVNFTNSTIASNQGGAGLFNYHDGAGGDPLDPNIHLRQTVLSGNTPTNCGRTINAPLFGSLGYNLDSGHACGLTFIGDLSDTNPLLGPLQDNGGPTFTHALTAGSPAIDHSDGVDCPATDQRGIPRPQGGTCDIGAFELVQNASADLDISKLDTPDPVQISGVLTYTIRVNNAGPDAAQLITVQDQLPTSVIYQGYTGGGWSCLLDSGILSCKIPALDIGAAPELIILVTAPLNEATLTNSACVSTATADPDSADNCTATLTSVIVPPLNMLYLPLVHRDW